MMPLAAEWPCGCVWHWEAIDDDMGNDRPPGMEMDCIEDSSWPALAMGPFPTTRVLSANHEPTACCTSVGSDCNRVAEGNRGHRRGKRPPFTRAGSNPSAVSSGGLGRGEEVGNAFEKKV